MTQTVFLDVEKIGQSILEILSKIGGKKDLFKASTFLWISLLASTASAEDYVGKSLLCNIESALNSGETRSIGINLSNESNGVLKDIGSSGKTDAEYGFAYSEPFILHKDMSITSDVDRIVLRNFKDGNGYAVSISRSDLSSQYVLALRGNYMLLGDGKCDIVSLEDLEKKMGNELENKMVGSRLEYEKLKKEYISAREKKKI